MSGEYVGPDPNQLRRAVEKAVGPSLVLPEVPAPSPYAAEIDRLVAERIGDLVTVQPAAPPPLTFEEIRRIAEDFAALPPVPDCLAVASDVRLPQAVPHPASTITDIAGLRIVVDDELPPGWWELRAGDRVVKRAVPAPWPGEMIVIDGEALEWATEIQPKTVPEVDTWA
jgi:hypothetical protein